MKAKDFNDLAEKYVINELETLGFKKSGVHFYLHKSPNIMVLHKKTHKSFFEGYYLAFTHDFIQNTKDQKGNLKIPSYLEDFPISIPLDILAKQYGKHKSATDFDFDINFLTREVLTTRKFTQSNSARFIDFDETLKNKNEAEEYISNSVSLVHDMGMRFLSEFSTMISYKALTKFPEIDAWQLNGFIDEIKEYMTTNNIEIPKQQRSQINRIFK